MKWMITGDLHGRLDRINDFFESTNDNPKDFSFIIAGDACFNYYLDWRDTRMKRRAQAIGCNFYCVRGNHEARPENISGMVKKFNDNVCGFVYMEEEYPNIMYLIDGSTYMIDGYRILILGGAYSVDKEYRKLMGYSWFEDEQLSGSEMLEIQEQVTGKSFDAVIAHTCPYSWRPTDLFLSGIDQSKVDSSMEIWLDNLLSCKITYKTFICGHYHDDRQLAKGAYMLFQNVKQLRDVIEGV